MFSASVFWFLICFLLVPKFRLVIMKTTWFKKTKCECLPSRAFFISDPQFVSYTVAGCLAYQKIDISASTEYHETNNKNYCVFVCRYYHISTPRRVGALSSGKIGFAWTLEHIFLIGVSTCSLEHARRKRLAMLLSLKNDQHAIVYANLYSHYRKMYI